MPSNPACSAARARSVMAANDIRICGRYSQNSGPAPEVMIRSFVATGPGEHAAGQVQRAPRTHPASADSAILIHSSYYNSVDHETGPRGGQQMGYAQRRAAIV